MWGNSPATGEFPAQRPVTRSFGVFFDLRLNKPCGWVNKSWCWWFETPCCSLWRHCNGWCCSHQINHINGASCTKPANHVPESSKKVPNPSDLVWCGVRLFMVITQYATACFRWFWENTMRSFNILQPFFSKIVTSYGSPMCVCACVRAWTRLWVRTTTYILDGGFRISSWRTCRFDSTRSLLT